MNERSRKVFQQYLLIGGIISWWYKDTCVKHSFIEAITIYQEERHAQINEVNE